MFGTSPLRFIVFIFLFISLLCLDATNPSVSVSGEKICPETGKPIEEPASSETPTEPEKPKEKTWVPVPSPGFPETPIPLYPGARPRTTDESPYPKSGYEKLPPTRERQKETPEPQRDQSEPNGENPPKIDEQTNRVRSWVSPGPDWQRKVELTPFPGPPEWIRKRVTSCDSPGDDWELEIRLTPHMGPPTWVPRGSQGTPGVNPPTAPMVPQTGSGQTTTQPRTTSQGGTSAAGSSSSSGGGTPAAGSSMD